MSLQTFPRFLQLPQELQIQVWKHAIQNIPWVTELGRHPLFHTELPRAWAKSVKHLALPCPRGRTVYAYGDVIYGLCSILKASRLSRQIMFEYWRDRVEANMPKASFSRREDYMYSKVQVLAILDDFIDKLRTCPSIHA